MTGPEFIRFYNRCYSYACRGAAVILLPGELDGERRTVGYGWSVGPGNVPVAFSEDRMQRAWYLADGAREVRDIFEREHGLVFA